MLPRCRLPQWLFCLCCATNLLLFAAFNSMGQHRSASAALRNKHQESSAALSLEGSDVLVLGALIEPSTGAIVADKARFTLHAADQAVLAACPAGTSHRHRGTSSHRRPRRRRRHRGRHDALVLLHLNVWNGCHNPVRRQRLASWLREARPDIVTLNELNGWDEEALAAFGKAVGMSNSAFMSTDAKKGGNDKAAYHVGIMSVEPVRVLGRHSQGFRHGALHVAVGGTGSREELHVVVTHLSPSGPKETLREAREILRVVSGSKSTSTPLLIAGDLNSLSSADLAAERLEPLVERMHKSKALERKFAGNGSGVATATLDAMLREGGLHDLGAPPPPPPLRRARRRWASVPTKMAVDSMHAVPLRLDYVLANDAAKRRFAAASAGIVAGDPAAMLSDHFPIVAAFCAEGTDAACHAQVATLARRDDDDDGDNDTQGGEHRRDGVAVAEAEKGLMCCWRKQLSVWWSQINRERLRLLESRGPAWAAEQQQHGPSGDWTVVAATRGVSCTDACGERQLSCVAADDAFASLNTCERMRTNFACFAGCSFSAEAGLNGPEQPAFALGGEFAGRCLLRSPTDDDDEGEGGGAFSFSCDTKHADTRRLCPCG